MATDTLAVAPGGAPLLFCSKATYLPHLRTIIAGTGMGRFSGDWAMFVNTMVLSGIRNLDYHTPSALCERWQRYQAEYSLPGSLTTTVYHFGFAEDDASVRAFAYRSTANFESEPIAHGFGLKPECTLPTDGSLVEALPRMMVEQRKNELMKPAAERLYIGGECIGMHLTSAGCTIASVFRFDDYLQHVQEIFSNHRANAG